MKTLPVRNETHHKLPLTLSNPAHLIRQVFLEITFLNAIFLL
jgi:hypothetical protein